MNTNDESGLLIAIDGIDGAGKTTQVEFLYKLFDDTGLAVVSSKEPTNGEWGAKLRESAHAGRLSLEEELDLFIRDRRDHVERLIAPSLADGKIVILDRYYYSTIAYQGARGANIEEIVNLMNEFPTPDRTFIFDLDPAVAVNRIREGRDETPNEFEGVDYLRSVRDVFQAMEMPEIVSVDSSQSPDALSRTIVDDLVGAPLKGHLCAKPHDCDEVYCGFRLAKEHDWFNKRDELRAATKK